MRHARTEGKAEGIQQGKAQQLERQQKALEKKAARHDRLMEALKLRSEERLQAQKDKTAQVREEAREQAQAKQAQKEAVTETEREDAIKYRKKLYREIRSSYKAGLAEGQAVMKEKGQERLSRQAQRYQKQIARLKQRIQNLKDSKKLINSKQKTKSFIKRIIGMSKSKSISWDSQEEIRRILNLYDLNTSKKGEQRRSLIQQFLEAEDIEDAQAISDEFGGITQEDVQKMYFGDMTLADVRELFQQINDIYQQGRRDFAIWQEEKQQRIADYRSRLEGNMLANTKEPVPGTPKGRKDLVRKYALGAAGDLMDAYAVSTMSAGRFLEGLGEVRTQKR